MTARGKVLAEAEAVAVAMASRVAPVAAERLLQLHGRTMGLAHDDQARAAIMTFLAQHVPRQIDALQRVSAADALRQAMLVAMLPVGRDAGRADLHG